MPIQVDEILVRNALNGLAKEGRASPATLSDDSIRTVLAMFEANSETQWQSLPPEIVGGGGSGSSMGMMVVRRRKQIAHSFKLSNFFRDPVSAAGAGALSYFASNYVPDILQSQHTPETFPAFLIGLAVAVLKAMTHQVGYGEAALLHCMGRMADKNGFISEETVGGLGQVLVEKYDYVKGSNSNEVKALLRSLRSWNAVEEVTGGYIVQESVVFAYDTPVYTD
jgi:hypothetical protein